MLICIGCGQEFEGTVNRKKYCSQACYRKTRIENARRVVCQKCGKEFRDLTGESKYCSRICYNLARHEDNLRICCEVCGTEFVAAREDAKYCSRECYFKSRIGHEATNRKCTDSKTCEYCKQSFPVGGRLGKDSERKSRSRRFCSQTCAGAARRNETASCQICGNETKSTRKFCSRACYNASRDHTAHKVQFTCDRCGKVFERWPSQRQRNSPSEKTYCSGECKAAGRVYAKGNDHPQWKGGKESWRWINQDGYVVLGGKLEHRVIMEKHLGRTLFPHETVHHINGKRDDNRPENLELWMRSHPPGQRVEDLLRFVLKHYTPELLKILEE